MTRILFLIIYVFITQGLNAQTFRDTIESLTKDYINKLQPEVRSKFDGILKKRLATNLFQRIDSSKSDYVFIEESYCVGDSSSQIVERYFSTTDSTDTYHVIPYYVPRMVYVNGVYNHPWNHYYSGGLPNGTVYDFIDYYFTLDTLIDRFENFKPVQELAYDSTEAWDGNESYFVLNKKMLEKKRKAQLKATYQINTMIDNINKRIIMSVQIPSRNPVVSLRYLYRMYDW